MYWLFVLVVLSLWLWGVCFICLNINLVIVLIDINSFVISGGILFKMSVLGIN